MSRSVLPGPGQQQVDLPAQIGQHPLDPGLLPGRPRLGDLADRHFDVPQRAAQGDGALVSGADHRLPRRRPGRLAQGAAVGSQLEPAAAIRRDRSHQPLVFEQLQRRIKRSRTRPPQLLSPATQFLEHLVPVHRTLSQQGQDRGPYVPAPPAPPPAAPAAPPVSATPASAASLPAASAAAPVSAASASAASAPVSAPAASAASAHDTLLNRHSPYIDDISATVDEQASYPAQENFADPLPGSNSLTIVRQWSQT